jgi:hypothetical protein
VSVNFPFLGRTWRIVVSPSQTLAAATNAALLSRSLPVGIPCGVFAATLRFDAGFIVIAPPHTLTKGVVCGLQRSRRDIRAARAARGARFQLI